MQKKIQIYSFIPFYALIFLGCLVLTLFGSHAVKVMSEVTPLPNRHCIIIDAGHGGVDGGATSCTGILESNLNLQICLRLDDLLHLLGYKTYMIRSDDRSIYIQGETISAKKVSDLKERVRIVNEMENATLLSIHQNHFTDVRYYGAQVFYNQSSQSKLLAMQLQAAFKEQLQPENNRAVKKANNVYLMEHVERCAVLIECGFISNIEEEAKLRSEQYQKKLSCVIAATVGNYLDCQTND